MKREIVSLALDHLDDRHISDTAAFSPGAVQSAPERIAQMKKKRIISIALAAALVLALGATAYAIAGYSRSTATQAMPKAADYTSLSDLPQVEKDVGYPVAAPERFSDGYVFAGLRVEGEAVFGEDNEALAEYYGVHVTYTKPGAGDRILSLSPALALPGGASAPEPNERRTVNGVEVALSRDHYKLVPEDYEKTEEDLEKEAAGHFYISFSDADGVRENEYAFAVFERGGVIYTLMDMAPSGDPFDALARMAGEVIDAARP